MSIISKIARIATGSTKIVAASTYLSVKSTMFSVRNPGLTLRSMFVGVTADDYRYMAEHMLQDMGLRRAAPIALEGVRDIACGVGHEKAAELSVGDIYKLFEAGQAEVRASFNRVAEAMEKSGTKHLPSTLDYLVAPKKSLERAIAIHVPKAA